MTSDSVEKPVLPDPNDRGIKAGEKIGNVTYHVDVPPTRGRGPLIPSGSGGPGPTREMYNRRYLLPRSELPLVPSDAEIAALPRLAREALAARCAERLPPGTTVPKGANPAAFVARVLFETATLDSRLTTQLRCIRSDFAVLKRLAKKHNWTDDTPVPADVFEPLWPYAVAPHWVAVVPD